MVEEYKIIRGSKGDRYMFKGKLVKTASVPRDVIIKLNVGMPSVDVAPIEKVPLTCIFCGMGTKITRFLNLQSIPICEEHYYSKNVGQIVHKFNEVHEHENQATR